MADEDTRRGTHGVTCSIVTGPDGRVRLVMDEVRSESDAFPQTWKAEAPFTAIAIPEDEFLATNLREEEYADIGFDLVARLGAAEHLRRQREKKRVV